MRITKGGPYVVRFRGFKTEGSIECYAVEKYKDEQLGSTVIRFVDRPRRPRIEMVLRVEDIVWVAVPGGSRAENYEPDRPQRKGRRRSKK